VQRTNDTAFIPIAIGTVLWVVAGIALVIAGPQQFNGQLWWIAACAIGAIAGAGGLIYLGRRARRPGITYE